MSSLSQDRLDTGPYSNADDSISGDPTADDSNSGDQASMAPFPTDASPATKWDDEIHETPKALVGGEEDKCPICLVTPMADAAHSDACAHRFCFTCITEWAKLKPLCPLCKSAFKVIHHGAGEYALPAPPPGESELARRFGYRSALSGERLMLFEHISRIQADALAVQRRARDHESYFLNNHGNSSLSRTNAGWEGRAISGMRESTREFRARSQELQRFQQLFQASERSPRHELLAAPDFRYFIYARGLRVRPLEEVQTPDERAGLRETSAAFYAANPATMHRLAPFLNVELHVLLDNDPGRAAAAVARVFALLPRFEIRSPDFRQRMAVLLRGDVARADHFAHELYHFARSPYDGLQEYFRHAVYHHDDAELAELRNPGPGPEIEVVGGAIRAAPLRQRRHFSQSGEAGPAFPGTFGRRDGASGSRIEDALLAAPRAEGLPGGEGGVSAMTAELMAMAERTRARLDSFNSSLATAHMADGAAEYDERMVTLRRRMEAFRRRRNADLTDADLQGISSERVLSLGNGEMEVGLQRLHNRFQNLRRMRQRLAQPPLHRRRTIELDDNDDDNDDSEQTEPIMVGVEFAGSEGQVQLASPGTAATPPHAINGAWPDSPSPARSVTPDAPIGSSTTTETAATRALGRSMAAALKDRPIASRTRRGREAAATSSTCFWLSDDAEEQPKPKKAKKENGRRGGAGFLARLERLSNVAGSRYADSEPSTSQEAAAEAPSQDEPIFLSSDEEVELKPTPSSSAASSRRELSGAELEVVAEDVRSRAHFSASPSPLRLGTPMDDLHHLFAAPVDSYLDGADPESPQLYPPLRPTEQQADDWDDPDSDLEVVADMKPKHLRTPPTVTLEEEDETAPSTSQEAKPSSDQHHRFSSGDEGAAPTNSPPRKRKHKKTKSAKKEKKEKKEEKEKKEKRERRRSRSEDKSSHRHKKSRRSSAHNDSPRTHSS